MSLHPVIGMDFGTTNSVVSIWDCTRKDAVVNPTMFGPNTLPSVAGLDAKGEVRR